MRTYKFAIQYRGVPRAGIQGVKEDFTISAEPPDGYSGKEFVAALKYMIEDLYTATTVTFQGVTE
jgi:hypothetical protein